MSLAIKYVSNITGTKKMVEEGRTFWRVVADTKCCNIIQKQEVLHLKKHSYQSICDVGYFICPIKI